VTLYSLDIDPVTQSPMLLAVSVSEHISMKRIVMGVPLQIMNPPHSSPHPSPCPLSFSSLTFLALLRDKWMLHRFGISAVSVPILG
jgi:hypothetical protein